MFYASVYNIEIALWWQKHLFWVHNELVFRCFWVKAKLWFLEPCVYPVKCLNGSVYIKVWTPNSSYLKKVSIVLNFHSLIGRDSSVSIVMGVCWKTGETWFNSQQGARDFFFPPPKHPVGSGVHIISCWVPLTLSLETVPGNEVDHSSVWCQG